MPGIPMDSEASLASCGLSDRQSPPIRLTPETCSASPQAAIGVNRPSSSSSISRTQSWHLPQQVEAPVAYAISAVELAPSATAIRIALSLMPWQMQTIIWLLDGLGTIR